MKLATWNVNSLTARQQHVLDWLAANPVDVLGLQELKLTDDKFPHEALRAAGYQAEAFGQKTYNGVALLSRLPMSQVVRNIPGFADEQSRVIAATIDAPGGALRFMTPERCLQGYAHTMRLVPHGGQQGRLGRHANEPFSGHPAMRVLPQHGHLCGRPLHPRRHPARNLRNVSQR